MYDYRRKSFIRKEDWDEFNSWIFYMDMKYGTDKFLLDAETIKFQTMLVYTLYTDPSRETPEPTENCTMIEFIVPPYQNPIVPGCSNDLFTEIYYEILESGYYEIMRGSTDTRHY